MPRGEKAGNSSIKPHRARKIAEGMMRRGATRAAASQIATGLMDREYSSKRSGNPRKAKRSFDEEAHDTHRPAQDQPHDQERAGGLGREQACHGQKTSIDETQRESYWPHRRGCHGAQTARRERSFDAQAERETVDYREAAAEAA